ncbi:MAG: hypothetical protein RIC38_16520 [Chromatocurvus sp.]
MRSHYADFGPTLASEKLLERDGYRVSAETLRQWMIAEQLWQPRKRRQARIHQGASRTTLGAGLGQDANMAGCQLSERAAGHLDGKGRELPAQ